ncbi:MAG: hypothetical protein ACLU37_08600 [Collinsella sp.]
MFRKHSNTTPTVYPHVYLWRPRRHESSARRARRPSRCSRPSTLPPRATRLRLCHCADLADRNRDLCDQIGEARLRNVTPATLSRPACPMPTPVPPSARCKRTTASVMRGSAVTATHSA